MLASKEESVPQLSELQADILTVQATAEECRRLDVDENAIVTRVIASSTGRRDQNSLEVHRGRQLLQVNGMSITKEETLDMLLDKLDLLGDRGNTTDLTMTLVFKSLSFPPTKAEEKRQERNSLFEPERVIHELTQETLLQHLQPVGLLRKPIKELSSLPSGSFLYFNHPNWKLTGLGALLDVPLRSVRELDLSGNQLSDVGAAAGRFEHMVDLRLKDNGLSSIELHYLPRLKYLDLSFNKLQILPELLGLPALQHLDVSDNKIGSRETNTMSIQVDMRGESSDGWERIAHSPLVELKALLLANNSLKWSQSAFNAKISLLNDKRALGELDFRGNPMMFVPRLDDLPPLRSYREWILTQCQSLVRLDGEYISTKERRHAFNHPMLHEPTTDGGLMGDMGGEERHEAQNDSAMVQFAYAGMPVLCPLTLHADLLSACFALPGNQCCEVLVRIQQDMLGLFAAPPQYRRYFESDADESPFGEEDAVGPAAKASEPADASAKAAAPGAQRREIRRRRRLRAEAQLRSGQGLLTEEDETKAELEMDEFLASKGGAAMLDEQPEGNELALALQEETDNSAALSVMKKSGGRAEEEVVEEVVQLLLILFERAPRNDSGKADAANVKPGIAELSMRVLSTCCALGGDGGIGEYLASRAQATLKELLISAEDRQLLIITQAVSVLVPPLMRLECEDWVQWSNLGMLRNLVSMHPPAGLHLAFLSELLHRIALDEGGTAPLPLFGLMSLLARLQDNLTRPVSFYNVATTPAEELHAHGLTKLVCEWLKTDDSRARQMDTWTTARQMGVWQICEGLARYVPDAAEVLVEAGAAVWVRDELRRQLQGGVRAEWRYEKTVAVSNLILVAEALGIHSKKARVVIYSLPSRLGRIFNNLDGSVSYDEYGVLLTVLPLLTYHERSDAVLLHAVLQLLGSLVNIANGYMLEALSEILAGVDPLLRLLQPPALGRINARAARIGLDPAAGEKAAAEAALVTSPAEVTDPNVVLMIKALVRVITAYARRAGKWKADVEARLARENVTVDRREQEALKVTDRFDDEGRDQLLLQLLNHSDDTVRVVAMECLSVIPMSNLDKEEVSVLVNYVREVHECSQAFVGRNEEKLMHAFNAFTRLVRMPNTVNDDAPTGKQQTQPTARTAGAYFRREHANMVLLALELLVENTQREMPSVDSEEAEQKARLSLALTDFLIACSGPAEGQDPDTSPPIWPQAVSVLQMRDATKMMLQVMQNEEVYGDPKVRLPLERSALANTVDPLLYILPKLKIDSEIKSRVLTRLAELLEGHSAEVDEVEALDELATGRVAKRRERSGETSEARRRRVQQHVSFLRGDGIDLVLRQMENELNELKQLQQHAATADDSLGASAQGELYPDLPADATEEAVNEKVQRVLKWVSDEEIRSELLVAGRVDRSEVEEEKQKQLKKMVDWKDFGIAALYSQELHLLPDDVSSKLPEQMDRPLASARTQPLALAGGEVGASEAEQETSRRLNAELSVGSAFRCLTACSKFGSIETRGHFNEKMSIPSYQHDALMIAAYAGVFSSQQEGKAALRFVRFWVETLQGDDSGASKLSSLPLLDTLARLLPRLLKPWALQIKTLLDLWHVTALDSGVQRANALLLSDEKGGQQRLLTFLQLIAQLYSVMLTSLQKMKFSKVPELDAAAKELAMRRLLPPLSDQGIPVAGSAPPQPLEMNALFGFLALLFLDAALRRAEGWDGEPTSRAGSLKRQDAVGAIKGVLGSFCSLDEERRFELFQMTARLEARWGLPLSPALMQSISDITEGFLYQEAVEPFLKAQGVLDFEGERVLESAWMVQESPRKRKSVLVIVTNHALYVLTLPRGLLCTVCESWKLCPTGPRFLRKVPYYKVDKLLLDFSAAHGAGHRFKLEVSDKSKKATPKDYQFSSLHVGVAQKLLHAIQRVHPRSLPIVLDSTLPRVISLIQQDAGGDSSPGQYKDDDADSSIVLVLRCERDDKGTKDPGPRLLVVDQSSLSIYLEFPEYFGLVPWTDLHAADDIDQPNGRDVIRHEMSIDIDNLESLDMVMSSEPQVVLAPFGGPQVTLTFADDAAAALFRQRMREVLWGHGQTTWNDATV